jgi:hypothetical protein
MRRRRGPLRKEQSASTEAGLDITRCSSYYQIAELGLWESTPNGVWEDHRKTQPEAYKDKLSSGKPLGRLRLSQPLFLTPRQCLSFTRAGNIRDSLF